VTPAQPDRLAQARFPGTRLVARALSFQRGGRALIERLDLTLESGQALVVTGPNGTGKSTLLRGLAGFLPPAAGQVRLELEAGESVPPGEQAHYVGHVEGSKPALTARENLDFWQSVLSLPGQASALTPDAALALLGVPQVSGLPVAYLSAGQKRRVGLARLLLAPRPLWILDEPLTALDTAGQQILTALMRSHLAQGGLIVAATHAPLGIPALQLILGPEADAA
jgi:heme exporter protein A